MPNISGNSSNGSPVIRDGRHRTGRYRRTVRCGSEIWIQVKRDCLCEVDGLRRDGQGGLSIPNRAHWCVITDEVIVDRLAVNALTVYGAGESGVYRLNIHDEWKQMSPRVPGKVLSLVVDRDRLYVATERRGMFHISLEEKNYTLSHR